MCGSFTCSKNTLVGLNVIYILVSFLMIGVAVHGRVSGIVTSLPIVGGITACGIFLLMISVIGLIGTVRHHQVLLFFYMVVLFLIFLIQFSVSCAALAINEQDEKTIIKTAWDGSEKNSPSLVVQAERSFDCCGLGLDADLHIYTKPNARDQQWSNNHTVFDQYPDLTCHHTANSTMSEKCSTCFSLISDKVNSGFNAAGGLGLFFSFTELVGGLVAYRYRNLLDPFATPPSGAPFSGAM
jgi:tetraspanin-13/31